MDLDKAMKVHAEWLTKFRSAIDNEQELDAQAICRDDKCELGQWLHGDAKQTYGEHEFYHNCVKAHAGFHTEAGKLAELINGKRFEQANAQLQTGTSYRDAANAVAMSIVKFRSRVREMNK